MKKILILLLLSGYGAVNAQLSFQVSGKTSKTSTMKKVILTYYDFKGKVTDTATVSNGKFQFSGTINAPCEAKLSINHFDQLAIYLDSQLSINVKDSLKYALVSGSEVNKQFQNYNQMISSPQQIINRMDKIWSSTTNAQKREESFRSWFYGQKNPALDEKKQIQYVFIKNNPNSYVSLTALQEIAGHNFNSHTIEPVFSSMSDKIKTSTPGKAFRSLIDANKAISIGGLAPNFTQNDVNDKPVSLSDFKGKYVLIDFWASWCGPCRQENPNLVKAYHSFKDKNFTVLGISLDQPGKKAAWLDAIKKDQLEWTQLSDLKFWNNEVAQLYLIKAIPQNFLISPEGKIIAINLRGDELEKKLKELMQI